jgi:hypothetical protein
MNSVHFASKCRKKMLKGEKTMTKGRVKQKRLQRKCDDKEAIT